MKTDLSYLSPYRRRQLRAMVPVIVKAINPEKIIVYGMYGPDDTYGPDNGDAANAPLMASGYDLLIVTRPGEPRHDHEIQDIIENKCRVHATVTVLVHDIEHVNQRLLEGQYFFTLMSRDALLLYDARNVRLVVPAVPDFVRIRQTAEKDLERWSHQAQVFFNSALFNIQHREWRVAVFLLHQSAEHIYQAILLVFMGYKPCTHNLDKLRRFTYRLSVELVLLFPRDGAEEDRLFRLLLQSYVDARYKEEYHIAEEEVNELMRRIEKLLSIARRICHNRCISLEKMAASENA